MEKRLKKNLRMHYILKERKELKGCIKIYWDLDTRIQLFFFSHQLIYSVCDDSIFLNISQHKSVENNIYFIYFFLMLFQLLSKYFKILVNYI